MEKIVNQLANKCKTRGIYLKIRKEHHYPITLAKCGVLHNFWSKHVGNGNSIDNH